jgi:16S rRNA (adenine1518-N6/adenine1519-N6)-dimethyltransferase
MQSKHKWGQNFLNDQKVLNSILSNVNFKPNDIIMEIGPGHGVLTKELQKLGLEVYAFEIDPDMHRYLDQLSDDKTHIIYDDFLNIDLNKYFSKKNNIHVVANIPYYITTPIIEKIINSSLNINDLILMVQEEVANRLTSKPGTKEYGYFTVYLNCFYDAIKIMSVSKNSFIPVPNVDSALIKLTKNRNYQKITNIKELQKLLKTAFTHKRKTLNNNLITYNRETINKILMATGYSLNNRAEDIPLEIWILINNKITI